LRRSGGPSLPISAGRQRKVAVTVVSWYYSVRSSTELINQFPFSGRRCGRDSTVKAEPKSPGKQSSPSAVIFDYRCKAHRTDGINRRLCSRHFETPETRFWGRSGPIRWRDAHKPPHPAQEQPGSLRGPPKANSKKGMRELFERLGEEFQAVAKTCEEFRKRSINADI